MAVIRDMNTGKLHGVAAEARRMNVSRAHLWLVLNGKRHSDRIMKKVHYREVK